MVLIGFCLPQQEEVFRKVMENYQNQAIAPNCLLQNQWLLGRWGFDETVQLLITLNYFQSSATFDNMVP